VAQTKPTLTQQFVQFLFIGALAFCAAFALGASAFLPQGALERDRVALRLATQAFNREPWAVWWSDFKTGYMPFFLSQKALVATYVVAVAFAWLVAFWYDTKILRKERKL